MTYSLDSEIINNLQENGRIAFAKIAKKLKVSPRIVQIHYAKMKEAGLIKGTTIILNLPRINIRMRYTANICINASEGDLEKVVESIKSIRVDTLNTTCWTTFGRYNITVGIGSTNLFDVHKLRNLIMQHPSVKSASININQSYFENGRKVDFASGPFPLADLDKVDIKLIKILTKDARAPLKEIGKTLGVSIDTVSRRIKRLEQKDIILGSTVVLSSKACGYLGLCGLYIKIKPGSSILNITEKLLKIPAAISLFHLLGEYNFNLNLHFREYSDIIKVVSQIRKIEEIESFDTVLYLEREWSMPYIFGYDNPESTFVV
jgi:Lrp/AsnC family transcriptional regulator for asnA, asnC and gidA